MDPKKEKLWEVHDLSVSYGPKPVLWNIDLELTEPSLVGVLGPNGAGKSTLIKASLGLIPSFSGWSNFLNQPVDKVRGKLSYVPQRSSIDWDFPVHAFDVVMMGRYAHLGPFSRPRKKDREIVFSALEQVKMQDFAHRQISELSGGQQQRIFLARSLAQESKIYLMDEPFAGVDAATEKMLVEKMRELVQKGCLVVVVHHNLQTVQDYFDQVVMLNFRLIDYGPTAEVFHDKNIQETYGGRSTLLTEVARKARKRENP